MFGPLKKLNIFSNPLRAPSLAQIVQRQLDEAERQLLAAEASFDHASATVSLYNDRCERLRSTLQKMLSPQEAKTP